MQSNADEIRRLSKKWIEAGDDAILDEIDALTKLLNNENVFDRRILERYKAGALELHFHIIPGATVGRAEVVPKETCAVAFNAPETSRRIHSDGPILAERDTLLNEHRGCGEKCSVLIDIFEFGQYPQRPIVGTVTRLQPLDKCLGFKVDPAQSVSLEGSVPGLTAVADGEQVVCCRGLVVRQNELINDVVQGGPKVVDAVSDNQRKVVPWLTQLQEHANELRTGRMEVRAVAFLADNAIIVSHNCGKFGYKLEVRFCPVDFCANAIKRGRHMAKSSEQVTPKGAKIPVPKRSDFLSNLKKVATPEKEKSRPRNPKK